MENKSAAHHLFVAKPRKESHSADRNIFASLRATQPLPKMSKIRGKEYDVVGPSSFRASILDTAPVQTATIP